MSDSPAHHRLAPKGGVFLAADVEQGILMDVVADRYWAINADAADLWSDLAAGAVVQDIALRLSNRRGLAIDAARSDVEQHLDAWADAGLLVPSDAAVSAPVSRSVHTRASVQFSPAPVTSILCWVRCLGRLARAKYWRRRNRARRGLNGLLTDLQSTPSAATTETPGGESISATVRGFHAMRLPFRQGREDCLDRSLELARALRLGGLDAALCIGIQRLPFRAHAWVEVDDVVVADSLELTAPFQIIARF